MLLQLKDQYGLILYGLLSGVLVGVIFDLYRNIRGKNVPDVIKLVEDILFWILAGISVFVFLLIKDYAIMGVYIYVSMILGFIIYMKLLSNLMYSVESKILDITCSILRIIVNNVIYFFKLTFNRKIDKK